jgi:hypothetical protein
VPSDGLVEAVASEIHHNDAAFAPPYWEDCDEGMKRFYRAQARHALIAADRYEREQEQG